MKSTPVQQERSLSSVDADEITRTGRDGPRVPRARLAGFALTELIIALAISALIGMYAASRIAKEGEEALAEGSAVYLAAVSAAAQQHILNNWNNYVNNSAVTGVATLLQPTVAELAALGRLNAGFPSGAGALPTRQTAQINITRTNCPGAGCQVQALVCTTTPVTMGGNAVRFDLASIMATKQGGTGGQSLFRFGDTIRGPAINVPNPMGNVEGIVCGSGTVDTALFQRFLVVNDSRDPNFQGSLTVAGAATLNSGLAVTGNAAVSGNSTIGGSQSVSGRLATSGLNPTNLPSGFTGGVRTVDVVAGANVLASSNPSAFTGTNTNFALITSNNGGEVRTSGRAVADRIIPTGTYSAGTACNAADVGAIARSLRVPGTAVQNIEGLVTCHEQSAGTFRWRPLIAYSAVGSTCSPDGAMADAGTGGKLLCVNGTWLAMSSLRPAATPGAGCSGRDGSTAYDGDELLVCRMNPAGGIARCMRLRDITSNLQFVQAYDVGEGTLVSKPSCAPAAGMSASAIIQLIPKSWSSPDGGQVVYALNLSNGVQWQIRLRDGNNNVLTGTPAARAIANVFCYFA